MFNPLLQACEHIPPPPLVDGVTLFISGLILAAVLVGALYSWIRWNDKKYLDRE